YREPIGWIVVHWDKRDDDLLAFRDMCTTSGTPFELALVPNHRTSLDTLVRVKVNSYHNVLDPPAVEEARVLLLLDEAKCVLRIELRPVKSGEQLDENVWRIKLGALLRDSQSGALVGAEGLFDEIRVKSPIQDKPRPSWVGY